MSAATYRRPIFLSPSHVAVIGAVAMFAAVGFRRPTAELVADLTDRKQREANWHRHRRPQLPHSGILRMDNPGPRSRRGRRGLSSCAQRRGSVARQKRVARS